MKLSTKRGVRTIVLLRAYFEPTTVNELLRNPLRFVNITNGVFRRFGIIINYTKYEKTPFIIPFGMYSSHGAGIDQLFNWRARVGRPE